MRDLTTRAFWGGELALEVGWATSPGRIRRRNEDALGMYVPPAPAWRFSKGSIFAVADGVDGYRPGHLASRLSIQTAMQKYYSDPSPTPLHSLANAVRMASWWVHEQSQRHPAYAGMRTTLVAAVIRGMELAVANVGDSRAYLARGRTLWQITRDHSWVAEGVAAGVLTWSEARRHPFRKLITRAIGKTEEVTVDLFQGSIQPGDILLLCSDGVSEELTAQEIWRTITRNPPQAAARRLINMADRRGGEDNSTAIVVRVGGSPGVGRAEISVKGSSVLLWILVLAVAILLVMLAMLAAGAL